MIAEPKPPVAIKRPTISLLSDLGTADYRLGAMRGVIAEVNPNVFVCDITHEIPPYDLLQAAFTLRAAYYYYPLHTIHVIAVEPGTGAKARPLLVKTENFYFIAPDNGVLSFIYDCERLVYVRPITATHYFRQPVNPAFHGRDVYASAAAYLAKSFAGDEFGEEVQDFARVPLPKPQFAKQMKAYVLSVDRFGNVITNIEMAELMAFMQANGLKSVRASLGGKPVGPPARSYGEGQGEAFLIAGGAGFLEIAAKQRSAQTLLGASVKQELTLQFE